jgi:hypothetical protein
MVQDPREPGFKFLVTEELLRFRGTAVAASSCIVIQQEMRRVDEHLARRDADVHRQKFEASALLGIQFDVHKLSLCHRVIGLSIELW